jgi:hypothetical protein
MAALSDDPAAIALDKETDIRLHRSRLMVAITAGNLKSLEEVLASLPPSTQPISAEVEAANKVVQLLKRVDELSSEVAAEKANADAARKAHEADQSALKRTEATAQKANAKHQAQLQHMTTQLSAARGDAPPSSEAELKAMAQETRIN